MKKGFGNKRDPDILTPLSFFAYSGQGHATCHNNKMNISRHRHLNSTIIRSHSHLGQL